MGGNTDAASRRLCFSHFCLFPAHRLCRDVGFIIVRSKHEVLGASPPTLSRGNKRTDEPQDKWLRTPRMYECGAVSGRRKKTFFFLMAVPSFP